MAGQKQSALSRARERRVALDRDRAARDNRVEQAAARVFLLLEQHTAAEQAMQAANTEIAAALRELLAEGIALDGVAQLCDLEVAEVRRLVRTATSAQTEAAASVTQLRPPTPPQPGDPPAGSKPAAPAAEQEAAGASRRTQ